LHWKQEGVDWVLTAQDKRQVTANMIMNLRITQKSRDVYYLSS